MAPKMKKITLCSGAKDNRLMFYNNDENKLLYN